MVDLFELGTTFSSHQPEEYGPRWGLGESQIWPTLKSYSTKGTAPFTTKSDVSMGWIPAPACLVYRLRFVVSRALWNVCFILALVCICVMQKTEPVGALDCLPVPLVSSIWYGWMILVCSSLHAIDRGVLNSCARIGDWLARGLELLCAISRQELLLASLAC